MWKVVLCRNAKLWYRDEESYRPRHYVSRLASDVRQEVSGEILKSKRRSLDNNSLVIKRVGWWSQWGGGFGGGAKWFKEERFSHCINHPIAADRQRYIFTLLLLRNILRYVRTRTDLTLNRGSSFFSGHAYCIVLWKFVIYQ